ncbi:auxin-responsive protein IAA28-like isoform X2 [Ipomoea triloba]|uniref:auxin-responsive protein IAA28-like isoform X2 n=1 Tax=Ipomoea triloba TaxID=35885 RepID=UPI00125E0790|nr:auxin-responsive protein IAA28-like isoform X2 [Ipomoea triloba]
MEEISKFLYAIPKGTASESNGKHEILENRKLELRLAPPGQEQPPLLSLPGAKRGILHEGTNRTSPAQDQRSAKNCRLEKSPVIGWPPVRSSRKNATASGSLKQTSPKMTSMITEEKDDGSSEKPRDALFVKVNMEGVPIGRKVDLTVYDNYEALYSAQRDDLADLEGNKATAQADSGITGSKEYTLVYEDEEGDRMLVGDVPWHMFISSAKRLRLLKKSEVSALYISRAKLGNF